MAQRVTDKLVKNLESPATGNRIIYDDQVSGFGIRITAAGAKSFILNYRVSGRERRYTIGRYPSWSVSAARTEAGDLCKIIDRGEDPMGDRHAEREAPTVADLCGRYEEEHLPRKRPSSQRSDKAMIKIHITPALGKMKVVAVGFADVDKLHRKMKTTPYQANRVVALLSKMFSLAIRWGMRADNPAKGIERFHEEGRERYLTADERARLLVAMQKAGKDEKNTARKAEILQTVNAFRLAMLTGCRIGEAMAAEWDQFDLQQGLWTKPSSHTKQKRVHRVWLNAPARALLTGLADGKASDTYLFPSRGRDAPQRDYKHTWAAVRKAAKLPDLRAHDLRHNFASEGASAGLSLPMIGALLGHTSPATTSRYAHMMSDPLKQAAEAIGSRLIGDTEPDEQERAG